MTDEEKIAANARLVVEQFRLSSGLQADFGYTRESVKCVEDFIEKLRLLPDMKADRADHFAQVFGSFLGECVIQTYGGSWRLTEGQWGVFFDDSKAVFPFSKVRKQFENGVAGGDSILGFFEIISEVFRIGESPLPGPRREG